MLGNVKLSKRLEVLFLKTKIVCFGRYALDVPQEAQLISGGTKILSEIKSIPGVITQKNERIAEEIEKIAVEKLKILVVNATGVAGYAGETKTALEKEGFVGVKTGNAKGTYDSSGAFVLMADKNTALIKTLEAASGKTLTYDEDYQTEDANGTYDAVIVLNDKK